MKLTLFEEFQNFIQRHKLIDPQDRVLMAVSGGIDSMVMAHLFLRLGTYSGIAHCNFSLRGPDSDLDEDFVRTFAADNDLPFFSVRFNTTDFAVSEGISVEMAARELRYNWFEKTRKEKNFKMVAVGHNLNDNIETLMINLTRGTGLTGLTGMKPAANRIIRPLLFASRSRIVEYCHNYDIHFREDKTNAETGYVRNKIRHKVIPVLMEINPSVEHTLNETAERLAGIDKILTDCIDSIRKRISVRKGETIAFSIEKLNKIKPGKELLFEIFSQFGITGATSADLAKLLTGKTGKRVYTKTHLITRNRDELLVYPLEPLQKMHYEINSPEELTLVPGIMSTEAFDRGKNFVIPADRNTACVDFDRVKFPLVIRNWEYGDIFYPLGMNHKKKLSDFFIDNKYPVEEKKKALVMESHGKIVWIIGERIDNRFKITKATTKILLIRLSPGQS